MSSGQKYAMVILSLILGLSIVLLSTIVIVRYSGPFKPLDGTTPQVRSSIPSTVKSLPAKPVSLPTKLAPLHVYFGATKGSFLVLEDEHQVMVINSGFSEDQQAVNSVLEKYGVTHVKYLLFTNNLASSVGGAVSLLKSVPSSYYLMANDVANSSIATSVVDWFTANNKFWQSPGNGTRLNLGSAQVTLIKANPDGALLVWVHLGQTNMVFSGSTTVNLSTEAKSSLPASVNLYGVTESDAEYSPPQGIFSAIQPKVIVLNNHAGVSSPTVLHLLKRFTSKVVTLSNRATLAVTSNGSSLTLQS